MSRPYSLQESGVVSLETRDFAGLVSQRDIQSPYCSTLARERAWLFVCPPNTCLPRFSAGLGLRQFQSWLQELGVTFIQTCAQSCTSNIFLFWITLVKNHFSTGFPGDSLPLTFNRRGGKNERKKKAGNLTTLKICWRTP